MLTLRAASKLYRLCLNSRYRDHLFCKLADPISTHHEDRSLLPQGSCPLWYSCYDAWSSLIKPVTVPCLSFSWVHLNQNLRFCWAGGLASQPVHVLQNEKQISNTESLSWSSNLGSIEVEDSFQSGIADSVASRILESILERVKDIAKPLPLPEDELTKAVGLPGEKLEHLIEDISKAAATTL